MNRRIILLIKSFGFVILLFLMIAFLYTKISNTVEMFTFITESEIIELFNNNKKTFEEAKNELLGIDFEWSLRKNIIKHSRTDWISDITDNRIQVIIETPLHFNELPDLKKKVENSKAIEYILKKLKFSLIDYTSRYDKDNIYFIKQTSIGLAAGIIYCPNGKTGNPYITKMTKIEECWFYYESK